MTDFEPFMPMVLSVAPGCPRPAAISAIRQAAIRFCEATRSWRCDDPFQTTGEPNDYICVNDQAELFEIEAVTFNGTPLEAAATTYLDRIIPHWRDAQTGTGSPSYFTQLAPDTIVIVPRATGSVVVHAFLRPAEDADELPEYLSAKHRRVIASGALADLLLLPGQPFFSPDLASVHAARFQAALDGKFNLNMRGQQRAPTRTRFRFF